ncbi:MAG: hypothetical protein WDO68_00835 [Gammaproteobacteria bacterium]
MKARDSLYHLDVRKFLDARILQHGHGDRFWIRCRCFLLLVEHRLQSFV